MKVQQFPDIDLPTVIVTASLPGAAPAQLETEVARKIENSIASIQGLKHIYTKLQDGTATITAEFRLEKPTQEAVDDVRDAVSRVRSDLPADLRDPVIAKMELSGIADPDLHRGVRQRMDDEALSWFVDNTVTKGMLGVRGVGKVARVGGVTREVRVELDPLRLQALGATTADISRQLRQIQQDASGGRTDVGGTEQSVRTIATVHSAEELGALDIALSDGRRIRLDQVATRVRHRGRAALGGAAQRQAGGRLRDHAQPRRRRDRRGPGRARRARQAQGRPPRHQRHRGLQLRRPGAGELRGLDDLMYEGAALAVLVVWLFLRDWRATLVAATALPLSVFPTFGVMYLFGFTLNIVTLLSLSLVVGILVDDAIVEIENIMRHLRMGKTPYQAAMEAADEIGLAVIATTFTLIAVFLPTAFMAGVPGKFFVQFGWTAAISVFFSLVVARMLTPMMAAYLLKPPKKEHHEPAGHALHGLGALVPEAPHPDLAGGGAVPAWLRQPDLMLPTGCFMPPDDLSQTQVNISLPPGSTFRRRWRRPSSPRELVQKHPHVKLVYTAVGGGATGGDPFAMGRAPPRCARPR
jgi:multidrug efflux pump subunit AcrB